MNTHLSFLQYLLTGTLLLAGGSSCNKDQNLGTIHVITSHPSTENIFCAGGDTFEGGGGNLSAIAADYPSITPTGDDEVVIEINSTAGTTNPIIYNFSPPTDVAPKPVVYIQGYVSTGNPTLEVRLVDNNGHITNRFSRTATLTNTSNTYTFDFSNSFSNGDDGSDGSSCTNPFCNIDPHNIAAIHLFVDRENGYIGELTLQSMQIGDGTCFDNFQDLTLNGVIAGFGGVEVTEHGFLVESDGTSEFFYLGPRKNTYGSFNHSTRLNSGEYTVRAFAETPVHQELLYGDAVNYHIP